MTQIIDAFDTTAMERIKTIEVGTMATVVTVAGLDTGLEPPVLHQLLTFTPKRRVGWAPH